jgi:DNA-binding MarR family transcriptional regulator
MNDMNTTEHEQESETDDPRQEAMRRLSTVGMLQAHQLRRAKRAGRGAPWLDPSQGQGRVLALLQLKPETTQKELTFLLGMSRQATAELLSKLEKQGLIEREPSSGDKRVAVVRLTEAGQAAEQATERPPHGTPELLDVLDDDEVAQLSGFLGRVLDRAEQDWADEFGERREAFEEFWRSRGGFDPRMRPGFGRGGFPGEFGGPGGFGPGGFAGPGGFWGPGFGGPGGHPGPHGRRGRRGRRDDQGEE